MNKLEYSFTARRSYDEENSRSVSIDFETDDIGVILKEFNKFLIMNDFEERCCLV